MKVPWASLKFLLLDRDREAVITVQSSSHHFHQMMPRAEEGYVHNVFELAKLGRGYILPEEFPGQEEAFLPGE